MVQNVARKILQFSWIFFLPLLHLENFHQYCQHSVQQVSVFFISILHPDLRIFFVKFHLLFIFYLDFYFPFSIWTFISLFYLELFSILFSTFFFSFFLLYSFLSNRALILEFFQFFSFLTVSLSERVRGFGFVLDFIHV